MVAVVASGKKEGGVSVQPPQEAVQPSPPVDPAKSALDTARRFARDHPQDWAGQRREFEKVALDWEKTAAGGEALREADRVKKAILSQVDRAMQDLEKELQGPLEKNDFARAIAVVDGARKRLETPDWELGLVKREREIRELRTQHEEKKAEGLVGHWRLSEGEGTTLTDASGNAKSAKIVGAVSWIRENEANALHFDGRGGHVELPSTPALDQVQDGSYTLAAWFKPDDIPQGEGTANDGAYAVLMKPGYHTGIRYGAGGKFVMEQWLNPEKAQWTGAGTWDTSFPPGSFYHVVGILNRDAGTITLWVNGTLRSSAPCPGNVPSVSFGHSPWRVGIAAPGATSYAWGAKGTVQEVRIYSRALGADEVQALYKARGGN